MPTDSTITSIAEHGAPLSQPIQVFTAAHDAAEAAFVALQNASSPGRPSLNLSPGEELEALRFVLKCQHIAKACLDHHGDLAV